jgi:hypothetical protein
MILAQSITISVADALERCGIPYMLSGSFASNYYGIPRSTKDADFVIQTKSALGSEILSVLGTNFALDPQLSFETNTGTFRQLLSHKGTAFKVEIFMLSQDTHDQSRFSRRRQVPLFETRIWLPSPEDVIVTKLRWARGKDTEDVRAVIAVQYKNLDWTYIEEWCRSHGTLKLLAELRILGHE